MATNQIRAVTFRPVGPAGAQGRDQPLGALATCAAGTEGYGAVFILPPAPDVPRFEP